MTVPRLQPWIASKGTALGQASLELLLTSMVPLLLLYLWGKKPSQDAEGRAGSSSWKLLFWVGLWMIPTSLLGRVKIGGSYNALSFTLYFWCVSALMCLGDAAEKQARAKLVLCAWAVGLMVFLIPATVAYYAVVPFRWNRIVHNPQRLVYELVKKYPGEVYAPWGGLPTVMAEGQIYHFDYALWDRELGGFPVSPSHLRKHLPTHMRWIVFPPQVQDQRVMTALPEFSQRTTLPELPGWTVYQRPQP